MVNESAQIASEVVKTAGISGILTSLGLNLKLFIAQLINFGIVILVLWRWVYRPLVKKMDERSKKIGDGLEFSKQAQELLQSADVKNEQIIKEAKNQSRALLEEAKNAAEKQCQEILSRSKDEAEKIVAEGQERLKNEKTAALRAVKREVASLVALSTEKVAAGLDEPTQRRLIRQALKEIESA